ncbi:MAG: hypothetical protein IH903_05275 [Proteobacteria bacterium]|nr:hypothetical protein [Pseudomonadota bacterium]
MSRLLVTLILCAALFTFSRPSNAAERVFTQPVYAPGTTFVMWVDRIPEKRWRHFMVYKGENKGSVEERYDFGRMVFSSSLRLKRKGSTRGSIGRMPIRFPISLGDSWKYSLTVDVNKPECGDITEDWEAKVATSMEKVTVSEEELEAMLETLNLYQPHVLTHATSKKGLTSLINHLKSRKLLPS